MTQFSDGIRIGTAGTQQGTGTIRNSPHKLTNIGSTSSPIYVNAGGYTGIENGVPLLADGALVVAPVTSYTNNLAAAQTVSAGGFFTLQATTGITSATVNGVPVFALDTPRTVQFTGASTATTSSVATVKGYDVYGEAMSQTAITPVGTATTATLKAFAYVSSIVSASTTTSSVSVGVGSAFGLPFAASDFGFVRAAWNQIYPTVSTGFVPADLTTPATAATGDVRGTYTPQTTAPNGAINLVVEQVLKSNASVDLAYGVQQA
jgi:hypothetical protein